jgi:hypothetical protein
MDYKEVINNTFIQKDDSVYDGIKNGIILARLGTAVKIQGRDLDEEKINTIAYLSAMIARDGFIKVTNGHRPEEFFDFNDERARILNNIDVMDYDPAEKSFMGCATYEDLDELYKGLERSDAPIEIITSISMAAFGSNVQCEDKQLFDATDDNMSERERIADFNGFIMREVYISLFNEKPEDTLRRYKKDKPKNKRGFLANILQ